MANGRHTYTGQRALEFEAAEREREKKRLAQMGAQQAAAVSNTRAPQSPNVLRKGVDPTNLTGKQALEFEAAARAREEQRLAQQAVKNPPIAPSVDQRSRQANAVYSPHQSHSMTPTPDTLPRTPAPVEDQAIGIRSPIPSQRTYPEATASPSILRQAVDYFTGAYNPRSGSVGDMQERFEQRITGSTEQQPETARQIVADPNGVLRYADETAPAPAPTTNVGQYSLQNGRLVFFGPDGNPANPPENAVPLNAVDVVNTADPQGIVDNLNASLQPRGEQQAATTERQAATAERPITQADYFYDIATDPNTPFWQRAAALTKLPGASRTKTIDEFSNGRTEPEVNLTPIAEEELNAISAEQGAANLRRSGENSLDPITPKGDFRDPIVNRLDAHNRQGDGVAVNLAGLRRDIAASPTGAVNLGNRGVQGGPDISASIGGSDEVAFTTAGRGAGNYARPQHETIDAGNFLSGDRPDATGAYVNHGIGTAGQRARARSGFSYADQARQERKFRGGAGAGAAITRQINAARRKAKKAYDKAISDGKTVNVARAAADAQMVGVDQLVRQGANIVGSDRNQVGREGIAADQEFRGADLDFRYEKLQADNRSSLNTAARERLDSLIESAAASILPPGVEESADVDRAMGEARLRIEANMPRNYGELSFQGQAQAMQDVRAKAGLLMELSEEAGVGYYAMNDLLSANDDAIRDNKLSQRDLRFWRALIEDGPFDALLGEVTGATEIRLPGTQNEITVGQIQSLYRLNRRARADTFARPLDDFQE